MRRPFCHSYLSGSVTMRLPTNHANTALFLKACYDKNLEQARVLLARGADVNWRSADEWGRFWSGLHVAAKQNNGDLVDLLLAQPSVDVNIKATNGFTPLMVACLHQSVNIIRKLLKVENINLNYQNHTGVTALYIAAANDSPEVLELLREAPGLEWNRQDMTGHTPLLVAATLGLSDIVEIIMGVPDSKVDITATRNNGYHVARSAVSRCEIWPIYIRTQGKLRCIELLSDDHRVDWNIRSLEDGYTPLLYCLESAEVEMSKRIIKNPRVDLNVQTDAGKFPETIARFCFLSLMFNIICLLLNCREQNLTEIMKLLWTFTTVQRRMITQESHLARQAQADRVPSLQRQSRDAVMLRLTSNNSQERLVNPLVDRMVLQAESMNQNIKPVKDMLHISFSGGINMTESDSEALL